MNRPSIVLITADDLNWNSVGAFGCATPECTPNIDAFGYIFNPWSDGEREFRNESQAGRTFKAMQQAGEGEAAVAARVRFFQHRVLEELYDFADDPDALHNLADDPQYRDELNRLRGELEAWMIAHADPALEAFRNRQSPAALAGFMAEQAMRGRTLSDEGNRR